MIYAQYPPLTRDVIATLTAKYGISEEEALRLMQKALCEKGVKTNIPHPNC